MPRVKQSDVEIGQIYASLCRGARGMLNWTRDELADASQLSPALIKKYETAGPWTASATATLRDTFRRHGVDVEIDESVPPKFYLARRRIS